MDRPAADALLAFVRGLLDLELAGGPAPQRPAGFDAHPHHGAFITLTRADRLRGCMGTFSPEGSLLDALESAARSVARDPRFQGRPVIAEEIERLRIEISIIGRPQRTEHPESLEVGRHGIWIRGDSTSGCFLPHVAVERGWTAEQFLAECCTAKAGLSAGAWKDGQTEVLLFEAEVLTEPQDS